ncbi:MAG: zf-HC2 domain-containing protein [Myxococcaceae bacterium]|nr:zf-HC2 domain-containing protein [Myxococcaceae bacterium]
MISTDLHPEELLDKAGVGTLTDAERAWLDAHLAQCAVCRLETKVKADFAAALEPEVAVDVDDVVARALAGLPQREPVRPRAGARRFGALTAAAVMFFAVASFAAVGQVTGVLPKLVEKIVAPRAPEPVAVPVVVPRRVDRPVEAAVAPVVEAPVEALAAPPPPPPPPARKKAPAPAPARVIGAAELFAEGNAARVHGDFAAAALRYRDLLSRFPSSDEALLTRTVFGRMLLDAGDTTGALEQVDAYLASGDRTLREEAMVVRARSLGVQGRTADAADAWRGLAAEFPDSLHARHANP